MRRSCKYCGRVHPVGYVCPEKPTCGRHRDAKIDGFRKSSKWVHKRLEILERDVHHCRLCEYERAPRRYNPGRLSVHHIEPLAERWDLRLEDGNLITCCNNHHERAERGEYDREFLHGLAETPPQGVPPLPGGGQATTAPQTST